MTTRRGRAAHVRPRPPSSGRPAPVRVPPPERRRVRQYRGLDARKRRAPLATRTLLGLSVLVLAGAALLVTSGGIGPLLSSLSTGFAGALGRLTATPQPTPTILVPTNAPVIERPLQPFTNNPRVELAISVPTLGVGDPSAKIRIYLALEGLDPAPVVDVPVGTTARMTVPFDLTPGRNDITARLFRGDVQSEPSAVVTWFLDQEPPKITVTSPKNNAAVDTPEVTINGTTQGSSAIVARNDANGTSVSTTAAADGMFTFGLPLAPGSNAIVISATDPAGNVGEQKLTLIQGSKDMTVQLSASLYRISVSRHPSSLQLSARVSDPAGAALPGAQCFFTFQIPGLAPISNDVVSGADGRASFTTPLVGTLAVGSGSGTVLCSDDVYGQSTDRVTLTFVK